MVGPEGMEKFCEDIGVEPENVSRFILYFGYFGQVLQFGYVCMVSVCSLFTVFPLSGCQSN